MKHIHKLGVQMYTLFYNQKQNIHSLKGGDNNEVVNIINAKNIKTVSILVYSKIRLVNAN